MKKRISDSWEPGCNSKYKVGLIKKEKFEQRLKGSPVFTQADIWGKDVPGLGEEQQEVWVTGMDHQLVMSMEK